MTPVPYPPYSPDLTPSKFFVCLFVSSDEKVHKGKPFPGVEEVKQKMAEELKGMKIDELKAVSSSAKSVSIGVLHQMESLLK